MDDIINTVKNLYQAVLDSDSDKTFYLNIHRYIDFVVKTPALVGIMNKSEEEYSQKHYEIWRVYKHTDEEVDEQAEQTKRLERFSLFASDYAFLLVRIYIPIESYKTTDTYTTKQAICSSVMLTGSGHIENTNWEPETIRLFSKWYLGKRQEYEQRLKQFHVEFLIELEKVKNTPKEISSEPPVLNKKFKIVFDVKNSILKIDDTDVKITLKNDKTDGHYVLEYIFDNGIENIADYVDIIKSKFVGDKKTNMSMYRACNDINKKVSEQAQIGGFLDIHSGKTGWVQVNPKFWQ